MHFWDSNIWSVMTIVAVLCLGMLLAHIIKNNIPLFKKSLIPTSVLGGILVLIFTSVFKLITKETFFDLNFLSIVKDSDTTITGSNMLEAITYHGLGIGFIAMGLRGGKKDKKMSKKRSEEVFNTGVTTVSTYLIQVLIGMTFTILLAPMIKGLIEASGLILALGYGQGTGQALNYGRMYENLNAPLKALEGGSNFGLAIAALGFLSASIGGVICLNVLKAKNKIKTNNGEEMEQIKLEDVHSSNDVPMNSSIDKLTIQIAIIAGTYFLAYLLMNFIGSFVGDNMRDTIFGFNFLIGTLMAIIVKSVLNFLKKRNIIKKEYINDFMMNRIGGVAFDIMIVAGIAVIDLELIKEYWWLLLSMGLVGAGVTFAYLMFVSKKLFKDYAYEQFFAMYGMLTGTASTGVILLREIDPNFETPAADNLVYQNLPAIVFGFPILLLANFAPGKINEATNEIIFNGRQAALIVYGIVFLLLIILLLILFRKQIFKKRNKK